MAFHEVSPEVLASMSPGMLLELLRHQDSLQVHSAPGQCVGPLPPTLGRRLVCLMDAGNRYQVVVASVSADVLE